MDRHLERKSQKLHPSPHPINRLVVALCFTRHCMLQNNVGDCYLCHERGPIVNIDYAPEHLYVLLSTTKQSKEIELEESDTNTDR